MPTSDRVPALPSPLRLHRARAGKGPSLMALAAMAALLSGTPANASNRTDSVTASPAAARSSAQTMRLAQLAKTTWRLHTFDALQVQTPPNWVERARADARTFTVSGNGADAPALTLSTAGMAADPSGISGMITASRARVARLAATRYDWRRNGRRGVMLVLKEPTPTGEPLTVTFTTSNEDWIAMRPVFERALHSIRYTVKAPTVAMPAHPQDNAKVATAERDTTPVETPHSALHDPEARTSQVPPAQAPSAQAAAGVDTAEAADTARPSPLFPTAPAQAPKAAPGSNTATPETAAVEAPLPNAPAPDARQDAAQDIRAAEAPADKAVAALPASPAADASAANAEDSRDTIADLGWRLRVPADWELAEDSRYGVSSWKLRRKGWRAGDSANGLVALTVTLTADAGSSSLDAMVDDAVAQLSRAAFAGETENTRSTASLGRTEGRLVDIRPSGSAEAATKRLRLYLARNGDRLVIVTALARSASGDELDKAFGPGGLITTALKKTSRLEDDTARQQ